MKGRIIFGIVATFILALSAPNHLCGQGYYSTLVGTVRDPSGAVVPNAEVTAIEVSTNVNTSGPTNASGDYRLDNLRPGLYSVRAGKQGFQVKVTTDVKLIVAQATRVDLMLEVGAVTQTVAVSGRAPLLQSEAPVVGGLIGTHRREGDGSLAGVGPELPEARPAGSGGGSER